MVQVKQETVTREVVSFVEEEVVTLTLTVEQAKTLAAALRHVGGPPVREDGSRSVRGILTDEIGAALSSTLGTQRLGGPNFDEGRDENRFHSMYIPAAKVVEDYDRSWF